MNKGQASFEYLVVVAFLLIATGAIFIYSALMLDQNLRFAKADRSLALLAAAADRVSARGPANIINVEIDLPNEIVSNQISIANKTISITLQTSSGTNTRYSVSGSDLNEGVLSVNGGKHIIKVEMVNDKVVFSEV